MALTEWLGAKEAGPGGRAEARGETGSGREQQLEGGDPACWAHLLCPGCGAVLTDGHLPRCPVEGLE